jgi:hypothetical protein
MLLSAVFLFMLLSLFPSSAGTEDEVKVTFVCPAKAHVHDMNWDNEMKMGYSEDPGSGGSVKLKGGEGGGVDVSFDRAKVEGQKISCGYRLVTSGGNVGNWYSYTINRDVIGCVTFGREIRCRVKP